MMLLPCRTVSLAITTISIADFATITDRDSQIFLKRPPQNSTIVCPYASLWCRNEPSVTFVGAFAIFLCLKCIFFNFLCGAHSFSIYWMYSCGSTRVVEAGTSDGAHGCHGTSEHVCHATSGRGEGGAWSRTDVNWKEAAPALTAKWA